MASTSRETWFIVASVTAAVACAAGSVALVQGCSLHSCDPSSVWVQNKTSIPLPAGVTDTTIIGYPDLPEGGPGSGPRGHLVDETTWQSGPIDGTYLDFPGQRTYTFFPANDGFTGPYANIIAYVSVDPNPTSTPGSNYTLASGNLAEIVGTDNGAFSVYNNTCAEYYLRVVVTRGTPDAGIDAAKDASTDGESEASTDAAPTNDATADGALSDASIDAADAGAD